MAVHHTQTGAHTADGAHAGYNGIVHTGLCTQSGNFFRISLKSERICRGQLSVQLAERILICNLLNTGTRQQSAVAAALRTDIQVFAICFRIQLCAAFFTGKLHHIRVLIALFTDLHRAVARLFK